MPAEQVMPSSINGAYPLSPVLPAALRKRSKAAKLRSDPEDNGISDAEQALCAHFEKQYNDAAAKTLWWRQIANDCLSRRFGDVPTNDDTDIAGYVIPFIGQKISRMVELVLGELVNDSEELDMFRVAPKPGMAVDEEAMRVCVLLELWMRDALREGDFYNQLKQLLMNWGFVGNGIGLWEWHQEFDEQPVEGAEGYVPGGVMARIVSQFPRLVVVDPRNAMPCSVLEAGGIPACDHTCIYSTMRYRDLVENEVRRGPDGGMIGDYANVRFFSADDEVEVSPISTDVYTGPKSNISNRDYRMVWWDRGFECHVTVGSLHCENVRVNGDKPITEDQLDAVLRKFGNDPAKCRTKPWWLRKVVNGRIVTLKPYPYHAGNRCPLFHVRPFVDQGYTFGRSFYDFNANTEELQNYFLHLVLDLAEVMARPPIAFDPSQILGSYLNLKAMQPLNLPPRGVLPLSAGSNAAQAMQELRPPAEAFASVSGMLPMFSALGSEGTTVTPTVEGAQMPGDNTATQSSLATNFSMLPVRGQVKSLSPMISEMLTSLVGIVREYGTGELSVAVRSPGDMQRLSWYDPEVEEALRVANEEKQADVEALFTSFSLNDFFGDFSIRLYGPTLGGGRAARLDSIRALVEMARGVEQFSPGLFNYGQALRDFARDSAIHNVDALFNSGAARESAAMADAAIRGEQGMMENMLAQLGGATGSPAAKKLGEASAPAIRGRASGPMPGVGL